LAEVKYISKIQLSDGSTYILKDSNALKTSGGRLTGDLEVDGKIEANNLYIVSITTTTVAVENVLTQDSATGEIKKRDADSLLADIGGYSCDESTLSNGVLSLKLGK